MVFICRHDHLDSGFGDDAVRAYTGMVCNTLTFSCAAGEIAQWSMDVMASTFTPNGGAGGGGLKTITEKLITWDKVSLTIPGAEAFDFSNFELTLTNPSTQQELLKSELMRDKAQTYTELTRGENGIAAMSHTNAKRKVWNMSDREIVEDLKQQKMQ